MLTTCQIQKKLEFEFVTEEVDERKKVLSNSLACKDLPDEIKHIILQYSDLPEIKNMMVDRNWYKYIDTHKNILWDKILKKLQLPPLNKKEQIKDLIQSTKQHIKSSFFERFINVYPMSTLQQSLLNDLNDRLANLQLENACELQQIDKARDILIFWNVLQKNLNDKNKLISDPIYPDLQNINSINELIDKAKGFKKWCDTNQVGLSLLQSLDLTCQYLTSVPDEIGRLKNLKNLNLNANQLTSLPPIIGQLTNLQFFSLKWNWLTSVPDEICKLTKLEVIALQFNPLISLPEILKSRNVKIFVDKDHEYLLRAILSARDFNNLNQDTLLVKSQKFKKWFKFCERSRAQWDQLKDFRTRKMDKNG